MNKKLLAYAFIPVMGAGLLGISAASAHGMGMGGFNTSLSPTDIATRQKTMFESQAQILGLTVDDVKDAWSQGKNLQQLAQEKGIKQEDIQKRMQAAQEAQLNTQLKALVDQGVITQAQADARLTFMKSKQTNNPKSKRFGRRMGGGFGMGMGL